MKIQKRNIVTYCLLNCITLGIYGIIVNNGIAKEINAICKGDGEQPRLSYIATVMIRSIPTFLGLVVGLIVGLVASNFSVSGMLFGLIDDISSEIGFYGGMGELSYLFGYSVTSGVVTVINSMLTWALICNVIFGFFGNLYLSYWWYKQASRLKLNANRYNLKVRESGAEIFAFRTIVNVVLFLANYVVMLLTAFIPMLIVFLINLGNTVAATIFLFIFALPALMFLPELSLGAYLATGTIIKNLNRFADSARYAPAQFNPMAYEYSVNEENSYRNYVPGLCNGEITVIRKKLDELDELKSMLESKGTTKGGGQGTQPLSEGSVIGVKGPCAGYKFKLIPNEEIIIGKDAQVSQIVIDKSHSEVSRKHVGITFDAYQNKYRIVDYSSNGTFVNGEKLSRGRDWYFDHGAEIKLVNDKNIFRLG